MLRATAKMRGYLLTHDGGYLLTHHEGGTCLRTTTGAENKQAHDQPNPEGAGGTKRFKPAQVQYMKTRDGTCGILSHFPVSPQR